MADNNLHGDIAREAQKKLAKRIAADVAAGSGDFAKLSAEEDKKALLDKVRSFYEAETKKHITDGNQHIFEPQGDKFFNSSVDAVAKKFVGKDGKLVDEKALADAEKAATDMFTASFNAKAETAETAFETALKAQAKATAEPWHEAAVAARVDHAVKGHREEAEAKEREIRFKNLGEQKKHYDTLKKVQDDVGGRAEFDKIVADAQTHVDLTKTAVSKRHDVTALKKNHTENPIKDGDDKDGSKAKARTEEVERKVKEAEEAEKKARDSRETFTKKYEADPKQKTAAEHAEHMAIDGENPANKAMHDMHAANVKAGNTGDLGGISGKLGTTHAKETSGIESAASSGGAEKMKWGRGVSALAAAGVAYAGVKTLTSSPKEGPDGKPEERSTFSKVARVAMGAALISGAALLTHGAITGKNPGKTLSELVDKAKPAKWVDKAKNSASTFIGRA